jgi:hypothetical protein
MYGVKNRPSCCLSDACKIPLHAFEADAGHTNERSAGVSKLTQQPWLGDHTTLASHAVTMGLSKLAPVQGKSVMTKTISVHNLL